MKRRALFIVIAVMLLAVTCVLCACGKNDIPTGVPVNWQKYLEEVAELFADEVCSYGNSVSVDISGDMVLGERFLKFTVQGNFDRENPNNCNLAAIFKDADKNTAFSLLSDDTDTYIEIASNPYTDNAKLKLQQTCIFSNLNSLQKHNDVEYKEQLKREFISFGKAIFQNADVNAEKTRYAFKINGGEVGTRILNYFKTVEMFDAQIVNVILNILGVKDINEIISLFDLADGKVNFYVDNGSISKVDTSDMAFSDDRRGVLNFNVRMTGEYNAGVKSLFPQSDAGYKVTKVGSTYMDGSLSLISSDGNKYAVTYNMSMDTNIDLMRLSLNGFDLDKLGEDNFFHFRLSHICSNYCSRYCVGKLSRANGAVLDIAYSPSQFGTSNVYICYDLRAFIERRYLDEIIRYDRNVSDISIPEYVMMVLPASNLRGDNSFMKTLFQTYIMLMGIDVGGTAVADLNNIRTSFSGIRVADVLFENMFDTDEYKIDTAKYRINQNIYGQAREYDIYKEVVHVRDESGELKKFTTSLGRDYTAYKWKFESAATARDGKNNYVLNNIYDARGENLLHGSDANGVYVPISDKEVDSLTGSVLKAECAGYSGELRTAYCEIVGVEGLDESCFDVQEVTLKVKYPNMFDYSFEFGDISYKELEALFNGGSEIFVQDVKASIKLTRERAENSFEFQSADTSKKYRLTNSSSSVPELLQAKAVIHYDNGSVKEIITLGKSDSVRETQGFLSKLYSIAEWGRITVKFTVAGRNIARYFDVEKPTDFEFTTKEGYDEIGKSCVITGLAGLTAYYGTDKVTVNLSLGDFYINNISLANSSADWRVYEGYTNKTVVFQKSNDYTVEVRKCGMVFGSLMLHITGKTMQKPKYKYVAGTQPQSVVLVNAKNSFSGTIVNATHGDGVAEKHNFDVKVMTVSISSSGAVTYKEAPADDFVLTFEIGGVNADNGSLQYELPVMILNPISVRFSVTIKKVGIYRVALRLDAGGLLSYGALYELDLNVVQPSI